MTWAGTESMEMVPPSEEPVSTLLIPEGTVASTIQMPRIGEPDDDEELSEEEIDDAVAEIQRAIQRAASSSTSSVGCASLAGTSRRSASPSGITAEHAYDN